MDDMTAFERQVAGEFVRRAGPVRPVDASAIFTAVTATYSPKRRFQTMFSATKFVVAGAIVALFGGFLLAGVLTTPSNDQPPAAGSSASPTAEAEPTLEVTSEPEPAPTDADTEQADSTERADVPGTFSPTGSLSDRRRFHTATLLLDGRVLVVGGWGGGVHYDSAEVWDPETGSFSPTGSLSDPRSQHTATLLPDGRVLIVGGSGDDGAVSSAEVWDPETALFSAAGTLAEGRHDHTATPLHDGRVLVVGGLRIYGVSGVETAEIWDPVTSSFATADLLAPERYGHTATLLDDGRVLIVGGEGEDTVEAWDPVTGFSSPAGSLAEGRLQHEATLLADGRVLVVGGDWLKPGTDAPTTIAEVWDPETASFAPAGSPLVEARRGHTATLLPDGRVLVIGGDSGYRVNDTGNVTVHATAEIWDPDAASFSPAGSLAEKRVHHTATLLHDGRVLVVGGSRGRRRLASAEVWEPGHGSSVANEAVRTAPELTTNPPIELPAIIPESIESGTLETPLGRARWVHLSGDETTLPPDLSGLLSIADGYVVPEWDGGDAKLWRSPDLISWASEPLGIEARDAELSRAGDATWLNVSHPGSLWRSPDLVSWKQVSLDGLAPPGPDGYAWTLRPGRPLTHGGVTIVPFEWVTDAWVVVRGLPGADRLRAATLIERSPGVFDIDDWPLGIDNRGTFITVRFEETEGGLRVLGHEDGTELKVLEGVSMEFIKLLAHRFEGDDLIDVESRFDEIAWQPLPRLAILDGTALVEVEPPLDAEPYRQVYTVDEEGFVSITIGPDGLVHMHRSQDGRGWREIDVLGDDAGEPSGFEVHVFDGTVQVFGSDGVWTLMDGLAWEPHRPPVDLWTEPSFLPIGTGWILGPFDTDPVTGVQEVGPGNIIPQIWFQPAEGEPEPIDITEMSLPAGAGDCGATGDRLSSNTIVCSGDQEAWIITFDDVPA